MRHPPSTHATGVSTAVVCRHGRPVGVVTAAALTRATTAGPADVPIASFIDVAVPFKPEADAIESIRTVQPRRLTGSSTTDRR